jgi:hypothetical protein
VARRSLLNRVVVNFDNPKAATKDHIVASVDPSGVSAGGALTIAAAASGKRLRFPRLITLSLTDASGGGGGLSCTVTVTGHRFGVPVSEDITVTCTDGNETTATGTIVMDQVTAATLKSKTSAASGDALKVGIDGTVLGLPFRIAAVTSVKLICNTSSGTEAAPLAVSSTYVDVTNSAIKGITVAATDNWEIQFDADGADGLGREGVEA